MKRGTPELIAAMDTGRLSIAASAAVASQPKAEQARIVQMPKDEQREVVARIRKSKAEREKDERRARDLRVYSELADSVQYLSRFLRRRERMWAGIAGVNGYDFAPGDPRHRAIQCLTLSESGESE